MQDRLLLWSLVALAAALVLAIGLGWVVSGRALRPLQRITDTARRLADRNLNERVALTGPDDELKELADTFDAMLERLDRSTRGPSSRQLGRIPAGRKARSDV